MDDDRMVRLINMVAPRTWRDAAFRALVFLVLINGMDFLVKSALGRDRPAPHIEVAITTLIALPFLLPVMAVLFHQRRLQQTLSDLATTDALTGLPNRRDFLFRAQRVLDREGGGMLLLLDADHFKRINDQWGHRAGDACLVAIGRTLRFKLRPLDLVGRLGGEEFAVFLPGIGPEVARRLGERLCRPIIVAVPDSEEELSLTMSVGVAAAEPGLSLDRLTARADRALYRAKRQGRGRVVLWDEAWDDRPA